MSPVTPLVDRRPDYDELLRLAGEATPGQWRTERVDSDKHPRSHVLADLAGVDYVVVQAALTTNAAYIAAASPDVVAALIRENRQQAERIAALETALADIGLRVERETREGYISVPLGGVLIRKVEAVGVPVPDLSRDGAESRP